MSDEATRPIEPWLQQLWDQGGTDLLLSGGSAPRIRGAEPPESRRSVPPWSHNCCSHGSIGRVASSLIGTHPFKRPSELKCPALRRALQLNWQRLDQVTLLQELGPL